MEVPGTTAFVIQRLANHILCVVDGEQFPGKFAVEGWLAVLKDFTNHYPRLRREVEIYLSETFLTANDINTFAALGDTKICGVQNDIFSIELQLVPQDFHNNLDGASFFVLVGGSIVKNKALDILKQKTIHSTQFISQDTFHFKEQSSTSVCKSFSGTGGTKRLTRETSKKNLEVRNVFALDGSDVSRLDVLAGEVMVERRYCRCFDFRSENAAAL